MHAGHYDRSGAGVGEFLHQRLPLTLSSAPLTANDHRRYFLTCCILQDRAANLYCLSSQPWCFSSESSLFRQTRTLLVEMDTSLNMIIAGWTDISESSIQEWLALRRVSLITRQTMHANSLQTNFAVRTLLGLLGHQLDPLPANEVIVVD